MKTSGGTAEKQSTLQPEKPVEADPFSSKYLLPPKIPRDINKKCLVLDLDETLIHTSFNVCFFLLVFMIFDCISLYMQIIILACSLCSVRYSSFCWWFHYFNLCCTSSRSAAFSRSCFQIFRSSNIYSIHKCICLTHYRFIRWKRCSSSSSLSWALSLL